MVFEKGHKINVGRKHSLEYGKNIGERNRERKISEETRRKISEARIGKSPSNKGVPCSDERKKKISEANKGRENKWGHHSQESKIKISAFQQGIPVEEWDGFKLNLGRYLRNTARTQIWRNLVFIRDNFTCQNKDCKFCNNKIGVCLNAHHILNLANHPEFAFDLTNGITYCKEYHLKSGLHKKMQKEC